MQYLKTICIPSSGLLFSSVCAESTGPNIDILIFPLSLKTVSVPGSSFSFIIVLLNVLAIYTQIVMSSGKHTCLHLDKQLRVIGFSLMLQVKLPVGLQVTNI